MTKFSNRLQKLIETSGTTQKELADALGISIRAIQLYESGKTKPNEEIIEKLADFFKVTGAYLLGQTKMPNETYDDKLRRKARKAIWEPISEFFEAVENRVEEAAERGETSVQIKDEVYGIEKVEETMALLREEIERLGLTVDHINISEVPSDDCIIRMRSIEVGVSYKMNK
jgi:transcriptional regulator with XRE-family HTH domain